MKFIMSAVISILVLGGCTVATTELTPETVQPTMSQDYDREIAELAIDQAWNSLTFTEQAEVCEVHSQMPDVVWAVFNEGSDYMFERSDWDRLMDEEC